MKTAISNVCSLEREELSERAQSWTAIRERALRAAFRTDTGARFEYARSAETEEQLEALIQAERECCAMGGVGWSLEKGTEILTVCVTTPDALRDSQEAKLIFAVLGGV